MARECRGMTMTALASAVDGLSQSNLSNYERGHGILSEQTKERIMRTLGFPMSFLQRRIENGVENAHYRKRTAAVSAMQKKATDRKISLFAYLFDWMAAFVDIPPFTFKCVDLEDGTSPERVAMQVRRQFKLGGEPLRDICRLLETNGVAVFFWDCDNDWFDGVSLITDNGTPLIIVNRNKPNDRIRFSLAHELGHILMHESIDFFVSEARDKEREANAFASELLMPAERIKGSLVGIGMRRLPSLKSYWKVSMAALLEKARSLGCIDGARYQYMRIEFSRNRWNKEEPAPVDIDEPVIIRQMFSLLTDTLGFTVSEISEKSALAVDIVQEMDGTRRNIVTLTPTI